MELQWPLILFTTLTAWGCGVLGGAGALALKGAGKKSQQLLAILSCVLLAVGGIAVFFHLQHWERIFNGFGHITSGITQELIAIVVFVVIAVAYFVMARKSDDGGTLPKGMAWVAIAISVILAAVCAHSYMMPARPAWDSVFEVLSIVGAACLLGPATCAVVLAAKGEEIGECGLPAVAGSAIGAVCTVAYAAFIQLSAGAFSQVGYYFDPTHPTKAVACRDRRRPGAAAVARCRGRGRARAARVLRDGSQEGRCGKLEALRRRGRGRGPYRRGLPARRVLQRGPVRVHVLLGGLGAWPGLAPDRLWRADSFALVSARQPPRPAAGDSLPGGGAEAGPPRRPHRVAGRQLNTLKRPLPLGDTLSPNPLANRDVSKRKGPPCVLGPDT